MRSATLFSAPLLAAAMALPLASTSYANILVSIDKNTQHMSVAVDGAPRYEWAVSTGRPGYDTPNGTFKINRMDADHLSQEWDNAPMPHSMFFDLHGHAVHGFFDVKHLGLAVSHGCVRLSPDHAATLFDLVKTEGMSNTTVVVAGQTPGGRSPAVAQRRPVQQPTEQTAAAGPMPIAPYGMPPQPPPYYAQRTYSQPAYGQPAYGQTYYRQPYYGQPSYGQPAYQQPQYDRPYTQY